ncbi:MAG: glutamine-hydrolyzing GMP synthase [Prevotella sp.]|nr:glutamine-hydrolyzing GMP synthase [Prevotella sp.]
MICSRQTISTGSIPLSPVLPSNCIWSTGPRHSRSIINIKNNRLYFVFFSLLCIFAEVLTFKIQKIMSTSNVRPADMERITTPALAQKYIEEQVKELRAQIGDKKVLLALSGGVDSSVVAALLIKAVGKQLVSVHVNHGLLRKGEPEQVVRVFRDELNANLVYVDATDRFLDKLAGVADPEQKRKIIGAEFIRVFEEEARKLEGISFLAQGTIYPDIVESGPVKSHHNVGGLPEDMQFELVEPIKLLFKDEVRVVGKELGLPDNMVYRQPFPGPGLGVRCTGAITRDRLEALRESDAILREEFAKNGLEGKVWQYFTIVPDYKSTGVKDNKRSWDWPVIIRAVNTRDAMTATIEEIPYTLLHHITQRIITEVPGVNRVLYDLTPKPTGTIEWE